MTRRPGRDQHDFGDFDEPADAADLDGDDALALFDDGVLDGDQHAPDLEDSDNEDISDLSLEEIDGRCCRFCQETFDRRSEDGRHRCDGRHDLDELLHEQQTTTYQKTAPHEFQAYFYYGQHRSTPGRKPFSAFYAIRGAMLGDNGRLDELPLGKDLDPSDHPDLPRFQFQGETWRLSRLTYQKGNIEPHENMDFDSTYEFYISVCAEDGLEEKKASLHITPAWSGMTSKSGKSIPVPRDFEGLSVDVQGSNLEPDAYPKLVNRVVDEIVDTETGGRMHRYVAPKLVHPDSRITQFERYVRIDRQKSKQVVGWEGALKRLMEFAGREGQKLVYYRDDTDIEGHLHRVEVDNRAAGKLISGHSLGKKFKHYHPRTVNDDEDSPLYHPKIGVALDSKKSGGSITWSDRDRLDRELDEALINLLHWSDLPTGPHPWIFVEDEYFEVGAEDRNIATHPDPTPELRAEQEHLVTRVFSPDAMGDRELDVLEVLTDGGEDQHYSEVADSADISTRTLWRALERLEGIVESDNGNLKFVTNHLKKSVHQAVDSLRSAVETTGRKIANQLSAANLDADSALAKWMNRYGVSFADAAEDDLEIDLGATRYSRKEVAALLRAGHKAWIRAGLGTERFETANLRWINENGERQTETSRIVRVVGSELRYLGEPEHLLSSSTVLG
ncbi:hypothetical protein GCM10009037_07240 [Halarchaeum grantii]|uniref:DUF7845 domain-containing protein n=1 Tax=Halarchaeum grantii TaxID=1193105 RepID=A0A830ESV1_9EURY|nr:hypothetical protein [Halarchaeum grantii]GGL26173.1 hypothetical protein GCM10009037_07240 [Halarchaeum grantii]